jgi:hypothetical protein
VFRSCYPPNLARDPLLSLYPTDNLTCFGEVVPLAIKHDESSLYLSHCRHSCFSTSSRILAFPASDMRTRGRSEDFGRASEPGNSSSL